MRKRLPGLLSGVTIAAMAAATYFFWPPQGMIETPAAPPEIVWGAPERPIRIVSYNILHNHRGKAGVLAEIRKLKPEIVLLQEVESRDVDEMARALGMRVTYEGRVYYPSQNLAGPRASWGNAILSTLPLYDAKSIPNGGGGSFGVWCDVVDGQRKFRVASVHLAATYKFSLSHFKESANYRSMEISNLKSAWLADGSPPIVIGGDFNNLAVGNNYHVMSSTWNDVLDQLNEDDHTFIDGLIRTRIDYFLTTADFHAAEGGVVKSKASDHRPIWVTLAAR